MYIFNAVPMNLFILNANKTLNNWYKNYTLNFTSVKYFEFSVIFRDKRRLSILSDK